MARMRAPSLSEIRSALRKARKHVGESSRTSVPIRLLIVVRARTGKAAAYELGPLDRASARYDQADVWTLVSIPTRDQAYDVDYEARLIRDELATGIASP